jgi:hypothetical protein
MMLVSEAKRGETREMESYNRAEGSRAFVYSSYQIVNQRRAAILNIRRHISINNNCTKSPPTRRAFARLHSNHAARPRLRKPTSRTLRLARENSVNTTKRRPLGESSAPPIAPHRALKTARPAQSCRDTKQEAQIPRSSGRRTRDSFAR